MLFEQGAEKMIDQIDYEAIKAQKIEMWQRFMKAKRKAEQEGRVVRTPL